MRKKISYLTVLLIANIISFAVFAQKYGPVDGNIKDSVTGAPVSKASVTKKEDKGLYPKFSDAKGDFSISPSEFPFTIVISAQGYKTMEVVVHRSASEGTPVNVKLKPTNNDGRVKSKPKSRKKQ
jgi:hypothetical protein